MKLDPKQILSSFKFNKLNIVLIFSVVLIILLSIVYFRNDNTYITYSDYQKLLKEDLIKSAMMDGDNIYILYNDRKYTILKDAVDLRELYKKATIIKSQDYSDFWGIVGIVLAFVIISCLTYLFFIIMRKFKFSERLKQRDTLSSQSSYNSILPVISDVKFKDVAGISEVKDELKEIVDFLKNPSKYYDFGIKLPKGVLMVGPPGVGKTLIAKAVAGEANVPFFYQSGSSFAEIYVGIGAKRVRELFTKAKSQAPSIVFIDEIDAVGKSRGDGRNDERETTLNQLLTEMDGFEENNGVIVIAATNKLDMIDEALVRPGRFDRRIFISFPNYQDRIEILKIYLRDKSCEVDLDKVSRMSVGFSGAGLATLVNEAAINALKRQSKVVELIDFETVKNRVLFGSRRNRVLSENEREIQSFYQGAKALCAYWFSVEFEKIGLLEDKFIGLDQEIESKTDIQNKLKIMLAGAAALKIYKNDTFTNGNEDLRNATILAQKMVYEYAMGDSLIPSQEDGSKILCESFDEVSELLKSMQNQLSEISKQIFIHEYIDMKKTQEIFQDF